MFFQKRIIIDEPSTKKTALADWLGAIAACFGIIISLLTGVMHLDGRILQIEGQNQRIQDDLGELKQSINQNVYPRKEAELQQQIEEAKLNSIDKRLSELEK
ncbi:hypothetical protein C7H19_24650 [Aphanothece hegewaldii CCALA 016]|uniref:Uncharacterized protein n=1 Tax=Aphanothece hegewaldii CCALA 016 TaxID=2107694 RepID=A0A2T1LQK3_9CHRO|nr:hypothetical protein [Aphanothece hegewaldii]PSF28539.1 hypothetical protein C7H19_24650 [Aphanothece hegewaldii CCALA 016]